MTKSKVNAKTNTKTKTATNSGSRALPSGAAATPAALRAALAKLGKAALQKEYKRLFAKDAKSDNVHHLRVAISKKLAAAKPASAAAKDATSIAKLTASTRERDPRLPAVGTVLKRPYKGVAHEVKVLEDAFEYGGGRHRSLSGIARQITGQETNGFLWFGLIARSAETTAAKKPSPAKAKA